MNQTQPRSDLVDRARRGDRAAFEELSESHRERLAGFIRSRIRPQFRPRLEMDDLVQEVFVRAVESVGRLRARDEDAFFGWLVGIAKNVVIQAVEGLQRAEAFQVVDEEVSAGSGSPSRDLRRGERFDRLEEAIDRLSADHREVVLLTRIEGLALAAVARRMGRSEEATKKLLWRALRELRRQFGDTESLSLPDRSLKPTGEDVEKNGEDHRE